MGVGLVLLPPQIKHDASHSSVEGGLMKTLFLKFDVCAFSLEGIMCNVYIYNVDY